MLSTADSVIVFVLVLLVLFVILYSVTFMGNRRNTNRGNQGKKSVQAGANVNTNESSVAKRLDPSASNTDGGDPRGVDIGGNYSK